MSPTAAGTVAEAAAGPPMKLVQDDEGAGPAIIHTGATTTPADSPAGKNPAAAGSGRPTPAKKAPERKPRKTRRQGLGPYRLLQPWQKEKLNAFFKDCPLPSTEQKGKLAKDMDMDVAHLQTWFINRRTKQRRLSERMSARHAATKAGAPGGVAGGGEVRKGKGKGKGKDKGKGKGKGKGNSIQFLERSRVRSQFLRDWHSRSQASRQTSSLPGSSPGIPNSFSAPGGQIEHSIEP